MPKRGGNGWIRAPGGLDELREFAGDRAEDVAEDETGRLKYFATDRPIKRLKALGDRLIMGSKSRAADGSDGNMSFSGVEKGEGVVPARGAQADGGEGRGREEDGNEGVQPGRLLTVRDLAGRFQVHEKTVYEWAEKGKLPFIRLGNRLRFDEVDITRWLASRKVT
jgi:excisionase family DNA binding protein